jgi:hypothetical protein
MSVRTHYKGAPTQGGPALKGDPLKGAPTQGGLYSMGPLLKGPPTQCPDSCVGDLLEVDACVGAPLFQW